MKESKNPFNVGDVWTDNDIDAAYIMGVINSTDMDGLEKEIKRLKELGLTPHEAVRLARNKEQPNHERPEPKVEFERNELCWFKSDGLTDDFFSDWFTSFYVGAANKNYTIRKFNDPPQEVMDAMGVVKKGLFQAADAELDDCIRLLRDLADLQNGPPLVRYEREYDKTMYQIWEFLDKHEKGNSIETLKKLKGLLKDDISDEQLKEMLED